MKVCIYEYLYMCTYIYTCINGGKTQVESLNAPALVIYWLRLQKSVRWKRWSFFCTQIYRHSKPIKEKRRNNKKLEILTTNFNTPICLDTIKKEEKKARTLKGAKIVFGKAYIDVCVCMYLCVLAWGFWMMTSTWRLPTIYDFKIFLYELEVSVLTRCLTNIWTYTLGAN